MLLSDEGRSIGFVIFPHGCGEWAVGQGGWAEWCIRLSKYDHYFSHMLIATKPATHKLRWFRLPRRQPFRPKSSGEDPGWILMFPKYPPIFWSNWIATSHDPFPPNGGLVREIPGYFRKIQVGELLFHLPRILFQNNMNLGSINFLSFVLQEMWCQLLLNRKSGHPQLNSHGVILQIPPTHGASHHQDDITFFGSGIPTWNKPSFRWRLHPGARG